MAPSVGTSLYLYLILYLLCIQFGIHQGTEVDPDERDITDADKPEEIQFLMNYMKNRYPGYRKNSEPAIIEKCLYSVSILYNTVFIVEAV